MFKKLFSYVREYKAASIATPICMIFEVLFEILIPIYMASIVDDGINKGDLNHIYVTGLFMVLLAIGGLVSGILGGVFAAKAATGFAKNLRKGMFDRIQTFSFANIDKFSTAGLITRLTTDVNNVQNAYQMGLRMCFRAPFNMVMAMTAAFIISPKIASVYLIAVVFLAVCLFFIMRSAMKYSSLPGFIASVLVTNSPFRQYGSIDSILSYPLNFRMTNCLKNLADSHSSSIRPFPVSRKVLLSFLNLLTSSVIGKTFTSPRTP